MIPETENEPAETVAVTPLTVTTAVGSSIVPDTLIGEVATVMRFCGEVIEIFGKTVSVITIFPPPKFFGPAE
ncbi:MAG: hypothetical protein HZA08_01750 [Nitrospirae bacterium]|nr:hypothetical protein [Nitrospirota bacterium]